MVECVFYGYLKYTFFLLNITLKLKKFQLNFAGSQFKKHSRCAVKKAQQVHSLKSTPGAQFYASAGGGGPLYSST